MRTIFDLGAPAETPQFHFEHGVNTEFRAINLENI